MQKHIATSRLYCHPRTPLLLVLLLALFLGAPAARATTMIGGEQLNPGERSHQFFLGFPEIAYQWDFSANGQRTLGLQIGILTWPFTVHVGLGTRTLMGIHGRSSISFRFEPGMYVGFYGGSRAIYENLRWGRSRSLQIALAPVINLGISASIEVGGPVSMVLGFECPVAVWFIPSVSGWWIEWPILANVGVEIDLSFRTSLFIKGAVGPSIGFAGTDQFAGLAFQAAVGLQVSY